MDQNFINDSASTSFLQYNADGQVLENFIGGYATINLTTDRWGFETSWEMVSDDGTIVAFVPPNTFPTLQSNDTTSIAPVSIFLNSNECYSFIIYDSGDGLCCFWGEGSYSVTDALGDTIVSGGEGMWSEEATHFKTNGNGTVINDIIENKKLIRIIDLLGRETKGTKNTPLFYIYDDGTVEKRIVIE
jgi:lysyl endopeptidase